MLITKRVDLGNNHYYIHCECMYEIEGDNVSLCLKNYKDKYYDGGDLSILVEKLGEHYAEYKKSRPNRMYFLEDCLYIYDNIPFISGVGDYYLSTENENLISSIAYVSKEELDEYAKKINFKFSDNSDFKLWEGRTWNIVKLYENIDD